MYKNKPKVQHAEHSRTEREKGVFSKFWYSLVELGLNLLLDSQCLPSSTDPCFPPWVPFLYHKWALMLSHFFLGASFSPWESLLKLVQSLHDNREMTEAQAHHYDPRWHHWAQRPKAKHICYPENGYVQRKQELRPKIAQHNEQNKASHSKGRFNITKGSPWSWFYVIKKCMNEHRIRVPKSTCTSNFLPDSASSR